MQSVTLRGSLLCALALLSACASNPVRMHRIELAELVRAHRTSAYEGRGLSDRTAALVDRLGLAMAERPAVIERLSRAVAGVSEARRLLARAELLYAHAETTSPSAAPGLFLESARDAYRALGDRARAGMQLDPLRGEALARHGYALTRFVVACSRERGRLTPLLRSLRDDFGLSIDWRRDGPWGLEDFDICLCADTLVFEGFRNRHRRPGIGVPLILAREPERGIPDYLTPEGVVRARTLVFHPATDREPARLELLDPRAAPSVVLQCGTRVPLAADFTAPLAYLLVQAKLHELEDRSFFGAEAGGHEGLFLLEDYDPKRKPVVMVHGLWSSPLTWRDMTNDFFGDDTLRDRYQVWHYMYATGLPLLENARLLRETLKRVRRELDPELDDPASEGMILVGHSMGGLLSRMLLTSSGDAIWDALFDGDFEAAKDGLDAEERALARGLYFWDALPFVERAIFIAAPHRGSEVSDGWIGRLGSALTRLSSRLQGLVDKIRRRTKVRVEVPTSVDELSRSHPVMHALAGLPMRRGLPFHSIMGDISESADSADWTDGVVRYESSRLLGAESELVIPGGDHGVHFDPRASAEVRRILRAR